jgi:hypothetical protein
MSLCIVSAETFDEMEQSYVLPYFANIKDKNIEMKKWTENPYSKEELGFYTKVR